MLLYTSAASTGIKRVITGQEIYKRLAEKENN